MYPYPPYQQFPTYPFIFTMPPPTAGAYEHPEGKMSKSQLKEAKRAIKFYQDIIEGQKKKDDEKKKKDGDKDKKPSLGKVETFFLLTFASPFIGVAYLVLIRHMLDWMQTILH